MDHKEIEADKALIRRLKSENDNLRDQLDRVNTSRQEFAAELDVMTAPALTLEQEIRARALAAAARAVVPLTGTAYDELTANRVQWVANRFVAYIAGDDQAEPATTDIPKD